MQTRAIKLKLLFIICLSEGCSAGAWHMEFATRIPLLRRLVIAKAIVNNC